MLIKLERGEIGVKLDAGDLHGIKQEFDRQNDLRILGLVLTAISVVTLGLFYLEGNGSSSASPSAILARQSVECSFSGFSPGSDRRPCRE